MIYDLCIVGGGIVGLATAMRLLEERPGASLVLIEKETEVGRHQTGHNSGVVHAGVYYAPGSLKAELCKAGAEATKQFAAEHQIPIEICGKLIVATDAKEVERMGALHERALKNGLEIERLSAGALREREPAVTGEAALLVPASGITDYGMVCRKMAEVIRARGGEIRLGEGVTAIKETVDAVEVATNASTLSARKLIACAGLQSDRIARLAGLEIDLRIVPFRGEYYVLPQKHWSAIKHLIYPVPDPELPFLGIHLTRMIDGSVTVGPNAVLGFSREGYPKFSISPRDIADMVAFPGFWKVIKANLGSGLHEFRNSLFKSGYLEECRKYYPALEASDLKPYPAGIRAQAVLKDGTLVQDFLFLSSDRMLHVCNAPSPAATSAIPIGKMIAERVLAA
jgi:L-2-hydroxyglutarate oxidase